MLSGVYDYFFGEENSNDSICSQENTEPCSVNSSEDDWCIVDDGCASGRSSPVMVPEPELRDIDTLSFCSKKGFKPISVEQIKRSEELRAARASTAQRQELERALFSETDTASLANTANKATMQKSVLISAGKLKRATAATLVAADAKTKSRSKKAVKTPANRNNNRKCQNLD